MTHSLPVFRLTPLRDQQREAVLKAFSQLLGVRPVEFEDRNAHRAGEEVDPWSFLLTTPIGLGVELASPSGGQSFASGQALTLSYRKLPDGRDAFQSPPHRQQLEQLAQRVRALSVEDTRAASEVLALWRSFEETDDYMFVQVRRGVNGIVRLGFRCNQNCGFCWQGRDWPDPPMGLVRTWLDEMAAQGIERVSISGGEPTLYKDLAVTIAHARGLGMAVALQTNAIRMAKPAYLDTLVEAGLNSAFVSFHSADPEVSDIMTRAPRTHGSTVAGIENLLRAGVEVQINCVVEERNYQRLAHHASMVVERFVRPFPDHPVEHVEYSHPVMSHDPSFFEQMLVPLDLVKPHLVAAVRALEEADVQVTAIGTCGFPPCLLADVPEALLWLDPEIQNEMDRAGKFYAKACGGCSVRGRCLGLRREYVDRFGDRGILPFA